MRKDEDCYDVLWEVKQVVNEGNYVTLDTETTSLYGQIIQWAVCDSDGSLLGSGYVKPTGPIAEGARAIHGISDEFLEGKPTFDQIADQLWALLEGKTVIIYNADFDIGRLCTSIRPYANYRDSGCPWTKRERWLLYDLKKYCAMWWFAVIYGELHEYYRSYCWQRLETACAYFDIANEQHHDASSDARATALLVQKLA